jgi:carnitine O-acetyltransferase
MAVHSESRHIVVLRRGQFCASLLLVYKYACFEDATPKLLSFIDWFDVLDDDNLPVLTEREVLRNLQAIISDADSTDRSKVSKALQPGPQTSMVYQLISL